jgi:hypothetical protein
MNNNQRHIIEGLSIGAQANNQIADAIAAKAQKMLEENLQSNFETVLQAKLSHVVQETLALHTVKSKKFAQQFLSHSKTRMAQSMIETQHNHRLNQVAFNLDLEDLEAFDTNLKPEVARLADEAGTITIESDANSAVGF